VLPIPIALSAVVKNCRSSLPVHALADRVHFSTSLALC
jgi:hypothetical protein